LEDVSLCQPASFIDISKFLQRFSHIWHVNEPSAKDETRQRRGCDEMAAGVDFWLGII